MKTIRFGVFGLVLAVGVVAAVSGLVAQSRDGAQRSGGSRPRVMMLDGRGGQLGIVVEDLDAAALKQAGSLTGGVRIEDVDQDGPAAKAGLREGDIVFEVDGDRVRSARQFARLIQETPEGRSVRLGIVREGQRQHIDVTPESRAFGFGLASDRIGRDIARSLRDLEPQIRGIEPRLREFRYHAPFDFDFDFDTWMPRSSPRGRLGIQLGELTPQLAEYFGARDGGVLVSTVNSDSPAAKGGLKAGDVITSVNGDRVRNSDDLIDELRGIESGAVSLGVLRDKSETTVTVMLETRERPTARRPI
jgi:S1-C subfamily serine protease